MSGPLSGIKIIEFAGIGPGPFCAMMLGDMGADVVRIEGRDRAAGDANANERKFDITLRNRRSVSIDLKHPLGVQAALDLVRESDGLLEGYRPGVMERLGLGPQACLALNPRLVFGRMTGWGQSGPLAARAGHDANYIALSGALHAIGRPHEPPTIPLNLVGDYGGGAMMLAFGMVCALLEASRSGQGQVVDAAMTDGAALLCAFFYGQRAAGGWSNGRGANLLDGGAPFYSTYECADGRFIAIAPIEPHFYRVLLQRIGLDAGELGPQMDASRWDEAKERLGAVFLRETRDRWCELLQDTDACIAPVLDWDEAPEHPHNVARETFIKVDGVVQPAPAPRLSRTPGAIRSSAAHSQVNTMEVLAGLGFPSDRISALRAAGVI
jgi:alpha-methylacyl-CoA racemase